MERLPSKNKVKQFPKYVMVSFWFVQPETQDQQYFLTRVLRHNRTVYVACVEYLLLLGNSHDTTRYKRVYELPSLKIMIVLRLNASRNPIPPVHTSHDSSVDI